VGKGTVQAFVPDLLHEAQIYRQLREFTSQFHSTRGAEVLSLLKDLLTCLPVGLSGLMAVYPHLM